MQIYQNVMALLKTVHDQISNDICIFAAQWFLNFFGEFGFGQIQLIIGTYERLVPFHVVSFI